LRLTRPRRVLWRTEDEGDAALDRIARFVKDNTVHTVAA
jgi:hypothetical protein